MKASNGVVSSKGKASITKTITLVRSKCFRNSCPKPLPSLAPSIKPGISAATKLLPHSPVKSETSTHLVEALR